MKYPSDDASSHEYEVKTVHVDGANFDAVVFCLRVGEPVNINVEDVLKTTNLWMEPTKSSPKKEHHLIFEVASTDENGQVELYINRFYVEPKDCQPVTTNTIEMEDAAELAKHSVPLCVREINLADARDAGDVFG